MEKNEDQKDGGSPFHIHGEERNTPPPSSNDRKVGKEETGTKKGMAFYILKGLSSRKIRRSGEGRPGQNKTYLSKGKPHILGRGGLYQGIGVDFKREIRGKP